MRSSDQVSIFLSSTFRDLWEIRAKLSLWLTEMFGARLIVMESFGSDADPPNVVSVNRVRECNFFVGIYAHRYGTIDRQTGKSITELELDEAERSFSSGLVEEILLYPVDPNSSCLREYRDTGDFVESGLSRLREKAARHTYTYFKNQDSLLLYVVRDLHHRLFDRLGLRPPAPRTAAIPSPSSLLRPVGMEFLTSRDRDYLMGRGEKVKELLDVLGKNVVVLLLGNSGVGKTSLIHAGLIPLSEQEGWYPIYTRPVGSLPSDIVRQAQAAVFEGRSAYRGPLIPLLAEITATFPSKRILLVVDQFEDILNIRDERQRAELVTDIATLRNVALLSLSVLISYRADLEGRLGQYWQMISGSPEGLPRVYLGGIDPYQTWNGIEKTIKDLNVELDLGPSGGNHISEDLLISSRIIGYEDIYPPYVQMFIDHVWRVKDGAGAYHVRDYTLAGGMPGIIGSYLQRQLRYAHDSEGHTQSVLVSLVRSYGAKAQKSIEEIMAETRLSKSECEESLEILIDLRLVRPINDLYEVSHDFIAQKIINELADHEEREFKRFRELLATKSAAYESTHAALTTEEMLMLYKYRRRLLPNDGEMLLLLRSWIKGNGPALHWLVAAEQPKMLNWLAVVESEGELDGNKKLSVALLRGRFGEKVLLSPDHIAFRDYQLGTEIATLIQKDPLSITENLLLYGLRHRREEVRNACMTSLFVRLKDNQWNWIGRLRDSSSKQCREAYTAAVLNGDVPVPTEKIETDKALREFAILKREALIVVPSEIDSFLKILRQSRPPRWVLLFGEAIRYVKTNRVDTLVRRAMRSSAQEARLLLAAVSHGIDSADFNALATTYEVWNSKEKDQPETKAAYAKAAALADAIYRVANVGHIPRLRATLEKIFIKESSRPIILAILENGTIEDLKFLLDKVAGAEEEIHIWSHTQIGYMAAKRLSTVGGGIPEFLLDTARKQEFWGEYIHSQERKNMPEAKLLPLKCLENRRLFIRLSAYAIIGAATEHDQDLLSKLAFHKYGLIAQFAAARLARLIGEHGLDHLSSRVDESLRKGEADALADALRAAEMDFYDLIRSF